MIEPTRVIVAALNARFPHTPIVGFPRLAGLMIEPYAADTGVNGIALDTGADLARVASRVTRDIALQGNLDPLCLLAGGDALRREVRRIASALRGRPHVFNLGHGVLPQTPVEHVATLVETLRAVA